MTDKIVGSLAELMAPDQVEYATCPGFTAGTVLRIGSLSAGDMIEWSEANNTEAKRTAGLRLIVKSLVNEKGDRYGDDTLIAVLRTKRHRVTENVVKAILKLNGMEVTKDGKSTTGEADAKND